mmetsp:Transcript_997/g.2777  ORF Transcript_997/g.2777 Transcript_997/m.2777 type:complete len:226 (-) Transcript_997:1781-2458(-)
MDPLGFGPKLSVSELSLPQNAELFQIDLSLLGDAILAQIAHVLLDRSLTTHALGLLGCKHHQTALTGRRCGDKHLTCVITLEQSLINVLNNGLEDSRKWLGKLIGQIPLAIDGNVVFKDVNGILGLLEIRSSLDASDDYVGDTITHLRRRTGIALLHTSGKLDVSLLHLIILFLSSKTEGILGALVETLGNHQTRDVHLVLKQIGNLILDVINGTLYILVDKDLV